jgi:hypothetical protein
MFSGLMKPDRGRSLSSGRRLASTSAVVIPLTATRVESPRQVTSSVFHRPIPRVARFAGPTTPQMAPVRAFAGRRRPRSSSSSMIWTSIPFPGPASRSVQRMWTPLLTPAGTRNSSVSRTSR